MSIPVFFQCVRNARNDVYVDGGVLDNYPVKLFDREKYIDSVKLASNAVRTSYYNEQNEFSLKQNPSRSPYIYNKETLGFRLDTKKEIAIFRYDEPQVNKIDNFVQYLNALIRTILEIQNNSHLHGDDWQRTIYIDSLGISTTDFGLTNEQKQQLENSGLKCTESYFDWFDNPTQHPINRP